VSDTVGRSVNSVDLGDVWFALTMERSGLVLGWRCLGRFLSMLCSFVRSVGRMWSADGYFSPIGLLAFEERNDMKDEKLWCFVWCVRFAKALKETERLQATFFSCCCGVRKSKRV
jgi:hypothetical protein